METPGFLQGLKPAPLVGHTPSSRSSSPVADGKLSSLPVAPVLCISGVHACGKLCRFALLQALQWPGGAKPPRGLNSLVISQTMTATAETSNHLVVTRNNPEPW